MSDALTERLARCYTGAVHDVMRAMDLRDFTLPPALRPILPELTLAGPAWTVEGRVDPEADAHATLLAWTGLLSRAKPGHIWVCQPHDDVAAHMGELSGETLKAKGVRGCIADGGVRDVNFLMRIGFQVWARYFTPRDIVGWWLPTATGTEIAIGGVRIAPGDYMLGDRDGLLRIPRDRVEDVVAQAEAAMRTENTVRAAILAGVDPQEAYLRHGKF
jgi:4-hydroxy-4-methyl-2-oxoglutarate aldolase